MSTSGPDLSRFRLGLVRLVTRLAKARFGQVGNQVRKVKYQVGQGQGQELDNICIHSLNFNFQFNSFIFSNKNRIEIKLTVIVSYFFHESFTRLQLEN